PKRTSWASTTASCGARRGRLRQASTVASRCGLKTTPLGQVSLTVGTRQKLLLAIARFHSAWAGAAGGLLLGDGVVLRVWATILFYQRQMKVISLAPQNPLITTGPYSFSRNPLYLGGNVFIFFGAALLLGSPSALVITAVNIPLVDRCIRREEG